MFEFGKRSVLRPTSGGGGGGDGATGGHTGFTLTLATADNPANPVKCQVVVVASGLGVPNAPESLHVAF